MQSAAGNMDRRTEYRVGFSEIGDVKLSIQTASGTHFSGQPVDLSVGGAGMRLLSLGFDPSRSPVLAVGEEVELSFALPGASRRISVTARVKHRADQEGTRRYGLQFTNRQQLESQLSPALYWLFNRRRAYRVEPAAESPVGVTLMPGAKRAELQARLINISAGGMGLAVPVEAESALAVTERIKASFSLPGAWEVLNWDVIIRHRILVGSEVRYGVEFDLEHTENAYHQQDAVVRYVMERHRTLLRHKSGV